MIDTITMTREFLTTLVAAPATGVLQAPGLTAAGLVIPLAAGEGAAFPTNQNFPVVIDAELMHVTRTVDTLNVIPGTRGAFNTTAAAHLAGAVVSQANLYLTVGAGVYYGNLPDGYDNDSAVVLFQIRGGTSERSSELHSPSFMFKCFGGSEGVRDAHAVYRMLHDRLQNLGGTATTEGRIITAYEESIGQDLRDPDTEPHKWPYTLTFFKVLCGQQA